MQASSKLAKQVSESVGKPSDKGQIRYEIRSRETSQTPTPSGTSEKSSQFQLNSHKLLQLRSESTCHESMRALHPLTSSHKIGASSKLTHMLRGEERKEVNATFKIANPDNFFTDTLSCIKPEILQSNAGQETATNGGKKSNHQKPTKASIQRTKSGVVRKTTITAFGRSSQEQSMTPVNRLSKCVISNQA